MGVVIHASGSRKRRGQKLNSSFLQMNKYLTGMEIKTLVVSTVGEIETVSNELHKAGGWGLSQVVPQYTTKSSGFFGERLVVESYLLIFKNYR
jgi:hypothetical protein